MPRERSATPPPIATTGSRGLRCLASSRWLLWGGGLLLSGLAADRCSTPGVVASPQSSNLRSKKPAKDTKMQICLTLPALRFVISEAIPLTVTFTNADTAPRQIPLPLTELNTQPWFTLKGPQYPQGHRFNPRSASVGLEAGPSPSPALQVLAPGQSATEQLPLHLWAPITEPGAYELVAQLDDGSRTIVSDPIYFSVDPLSVQSAAIAADVGARSQRQVRSAWVIDGERERRLYMASYTEGRPELGEAPTAALRFVQALPQSGTSVYVPWTNYDRTESFHHWYLWRQESTLCARALLSQRPGCIDLPAPLDSVVRSPLLVRSGEVDVFVLAAGGHEIGLVRFPPPAKEQDTIEPRLLWRYPVRGKLVSARASLSAPPANERRLVVVTQLQDAVEIHHINVGAGARPSASQSFLLRDVVAAPGSEPGIMIDGQGFTQLSVILESQRRAQGIVILDATLKPDGQWLGPPVARQLGITEDPLRFAAIAFPVQAQSAMRRDWLVATSSQKIYGGTFGQKTARQAGGAPVLPFEMIALSQATYYMVKEAKSGVVLGIVR